MVKFNTVVAEGRPDYSINWEVAAVLPPSPNAQQQLGLAGPVVGSQKGLLIVGGGANFPDKMPWFGGQKRYHDNVFIFAKDENGKVISHNQIYKLPFPIAYGASSNTPYGVVYAGGENEQGLSNKIVLIQWNELVNKIEFTTLPHLPFAVANAAMTSIGSTLYIAGGELSDSVSDLFLALDLADQSRGWQSMPVLPYPVSHSVMVAHSNGINDCIYMIGGRRRNTGKISSLYSSIFQFDPKENLWSQKADLPYNLSAGTGVAINNKSILLFGGDRGETFHKAESLIISIANETDLLEKEKLNQEKITVQTNHPGFSRTILEYNTQENTISAVNTMLFDVPVTTTALIWDDKIVIPSGEIKAGIRTPNILSGQIK